MAKQKEPRPPVNPRTRASLYGLCTLYLAYLYYGIAKPFLTHDPYGPTAAQFAAGTVVLGGGMVFLGLMTWKMYKMPIPEELLDTEEDSALPEDGGEEDAFDGDEGEE